MGRNTILVQVSPRIYILGTSTSPARRNLTTATLQPKNTKRSWEWRFAASAEERILDWEYRILAEFRQVEAKLRSSIAKSFTRSYGFHDFTQSSTSGEDPIIVLTTRRVRVADLVNMAKLNS
jgi:hypothetical protein